MNKEKLIEEYLAEPIKVGDDVKVRGLGLQNKSSWGQSTDVKKVLEDGSIVIQRYRHNEETVKPEDYEKTIRHIGLDPFSKKFRIDSLQIDIESLLLKVGWEKKDDGILTEGEVDWNPTVTVDDEKFIFQREFIWDLEDKQLLIDSIYNHRDIGKFLIKKNNIGTVCDLQGKGEEAYFREIIDGKQRLNALLEFVQNKFADSNGNFYSEFSESAKRKFTGYMNFSFGEIDDRATDQNILDIFLMVNHTGKQMAIEHINFVKDLRKKM